MNYAEHRNIPRQRIGLRGGIGDATVAMGNSLSNDNLDAAWSAGMNTTDFNTASNLFTQAQVAMAQGWSPSAAALANIQKWQAYAPKLAAVSKLTPAQYAQYKAQGSYNAATGTVSLTGGGGGILSTLSSLPVVGGLISKYTGGAAPAATFTPAPQTSWLSGTTVFLLAIAGGVTYVILAPKPKKAG